MENNGKVACIGSGTIGGSWAALFSAKGYRVGLYDLEKNRLEEALDNIESQLDFLSENDFLENSPKDLIERIIPTTELSRALRNVDYAQESVPENYDTKKKVFRKMDKMTPESTILASSTSGLLMTEIQKDTKNPERCVTAHPWNPPLLIPLVEVVPGKKTSNETVDRTIKIMKRLDKTPIRLKKEVPGFIGNRFQAAVWREAFSLVDRGIASVEEVDKALSSGPGLRWAFMGAHLTLHIGGGKGGISHHIAHLADSYKNRWEDMDNWVSIPYTAAQKVIDGMGKYEKVKEKDYDGLVKWRDSKLIRLLKELRDQRSL